MSFPARSRIVTARIDGEDLVISGDGVELFHIPRRVGMWLIARIAKALVEQRP